MSSVVSHVTGHVMANANKNLCKTKKFLIMQICFNHINFMIFLNKMNVSDYKLLMCQCSQAQETVTHVIIHCFRFVKIKYILKIFVTNQLNIQILTDISASIQCLTK